MHTSTHKGKRVYVILKDGTSFVDKFLDKKARHIHFENQTIKVKDLRSMTIHRHQT